MFSADLVSIEPLEGLVCRMATLMDAKTESASVCVVVASGKIVRESKVATEPAALIGWLASLERIGLGLDPCPNGFMRPCGKKVLRSSFW